MRRMPLFSRTGLKWRFTRPVQRIAAAGGRGKDQSLVLPDARVAEVLYGLPDAEGLEGVYRAMGTRPGGVGEKRVAGVPT